MELSSVDEGCFHKIQRAFSNAFSVDTQIVKINSVPQDVPGWDSLGHVTLASSLEDEFGLSFSIDEVMEMENVTAIYQVLKRRLNLAG